MTRNLLHGLKDAGVRLHFVAIVDDDVDRDDVRRWYGALPDRFTMITTRLRIPFQAGKYHRLVRMLAGVGFPRLLRHDLEEVDVPRGCMIITHSPSVESILVANQIRRGRPDIRYIQYWSDPITLSGINPEDFSFRRYPFWVLERGLLSTSTRIVYGTKTLASFQQRLFPALSGRMSSVDIGYSPGGA
jgi:hypothetical protein